MCYSSGMAMNDTTTTTDDQPRRQADNLTGAECAARDYAYGRGAYVTANRARTEAGNAAWAVRNGYGHKLAGQTEAWWLDYAAEIKALELAEMRTVGTIVSQLLVTDTRCYEVIGVTPQTLKLRRTKDGERSWRDTNMGDGPWPVMLHEQVPDPAGPVITVRLRRDGTYRPGEGVQHALRLCRQHEGVPVAVIDHRF